MIGANDTGEDVIGLVRSDERFWTIFVHCNVLVDCADQASNPAKHDVAQACVGDVAKEALDHIAPGRRGRGEMLMEPKVLATTLRSLWIAELSQIR